MLLFRQLPNPMTPENSCSVYLLRRNSQLMGKNGFLFCFLQMHKYGSGQLIHDEVRFYHLPTKLREGNVLVLFCMFTLSMIHWTSLYRVPSHPAPRPRQQTIRHEPQSLLIVTSGGYHWNLFKLVHLRMYLSVLTSGDQSPYGWQAGSKHTTGMFSCYDHEQF